MFTVSLVIEYMQEHIHNIVHCIYLTWRALLRSLVKTPDARPYSVAFALQITPSTSLRGERGRENGVRRSEKDGGSVLFGLVCSNYGCSTIAI